jgi:hypothetical protein
METNKACIQGSCKINHDLNINSLSPHVDENNTQMNEHIYIYIYLLHHCIIISVPESEGCIGVVDVGDGVVGSIVSVKQERGIVTIYQL